MFLHDFGILFVLWLVSFGLGLASFPVSFLLFSSLSDKGYTFSKLLGLFLVSYIFFALASFKLIPLSLFWLLIVCGAWLAVNIFVARKFFVSLFAFALARWKQILRIEFGFFALSAFWLFARGHDPAIHGIERFMDFGFIQALFNSHSLPLQDIWFAGQPVNYYYFGHFMAYVMLSLGRIPVTLGFLALVAWMFGLLGIGVYRIGRDLLRLLLPSSEGVLKFCAGALSAFAVLFAGTWHTSIWGIHWLLHVFFKIPVRFYWYPEPTRVIPGTITEMPIYSFILSDLHAHVWGLLVGSFVIGLLLTFWLKKNVSTKDIVLFAAFGALALGISFMANAWDALTLGVLTELVFFFKLWPRQTRVKTFVVLLFIPVGAFIVGLPWKLFYFSPVSGIGLVKHLSPLLPWISFWGAILLVFFLSIPSMLVWQLRKKSANFNFHFLIFIAFALFLLLMEVFYIKDILVQGEWYRANTVFKITAQLWLWSGVAAGSLLVWFIFSFNKTIFKILAGIVCLLLLLSQAAYPIEAIWQTEFQNRSYKGLGAGLEWWQQKYPDDFKAHLFLKNVRDALPQNDKLKIIVEAEGESYTDDSRFSVFLGWPTIVGWAVHEWTWRGAFTDVGTRGGLVREVYTGANIEKAKQILQQYKVNYIIVGEREYEKYGNNLQKQKLLQLGTVVFQSGNTFAVQVKE